MPDIKELIDITREFKRNHDKYKKIINKTPLASPLKIDADITSNIIAEGTFIKYFTLWENVIEKSFIYFCLGGFTFNNKQPVCRLTNCNNEIARNILLNRARYIDWSSPNVIKERANLFFQIGGLFHDPITSNSSYLCDAEKVRNVIAHDSLESWNGYIKVLTNNFKTRPIFKMQPGQMLRIKCYKNTRLSWGEYYFNIFYNTFIAIVVPK
ncbi:MAG: hypothetical protein M0Z72_03765 [Deltaproteobacteria bacterium]|nr:hypothetical protein [Deltaproteobacteria bacterium]